MANNNRLHGYKGKRTAGQIFQGISPKNPKTAILQKFASNFPYNKPKPVYVTLGSRLKIHPSLDIQVHRTAGSLILCLVL